MFQQQEGQMGLDEWEDRATGRMDWLDGSTHGWEGRIQVTDQVTDEKDGSKWRMQRLCGGRWTRMPGTKKNRRSNARDREADEFLYHPIPRFSSPARAFGI